tara:strand:+ start:93443 stop:94108 length:666 start_codon:yes stop_codon:yes gene_type:complete
MTSFEDNILVIDKEIEKRRSKWTLTIIAWMDYDDVSQIIRTHIWNKWHLYDQKQRLEPWLNKVINHRIKNLIRDNYGNFARPCLKCEAAKGDDLCTLYGKQCDDCPLYYDWTINKKRAYDAKLPVSIEQHLFFVGQEVDLGIDIDKLFKELSELLKDSLKPIEWRVFKSLYIDNKEEKDVAKEMGYITNEKSRNPGYRQMINIKKAIIKKAKKHIKEDMDL